jgi:hypothetical protein
LKWSGVFVLLSFFSGNRRAKFLKIFVNVHRHQPRRAVGMIASAVQFLIFKRMTDIEKRLPVMLMTGV